MRLLAFGYGYTARALAGRLDAEVVAIGRETPSPDVLDEAVARADAILISAPPTEAGCPALPVLVPALARARAFPDWIGYLSSTGVYGDRKGGWVTEASGLAAQSMEGARRVAAERDWLEVGRGMGLTVTAFRLAGLYGPGRSAFDRLRAGAARRVIAPGHVFSRLHVDDAAAGLAASIARPRAGGIYNLCDDEPAESAEVTAWAARLLGLPPPPEAPRPEGRFWAESRRVSNARAKAELGWRPAWPTYREGLSAILAAGG